MPSFKKPNMSQFNSAIRKAKSANNQFQREANKAIRDLKNLESKTKSAQRQLRSSTRPSVISANSNHDRVQNLYDALHYQDSHEYTPISEIRDVFVSYAHEDKLSFVMPLVSAMKNRGISRWYDEEQQVNMWGRSLREEIDNGIRQSRFCIVVFSKAYFKKYWTKKELDGILMKERIDNGQILPIWHDITEQDMYEFSPSLTGLLAFSTEVYSIDEICDALESKIRDANGVEISY